LTRELRMELSAGPHDRKLLPDLDAGLRARVDVDQVALGGHAARPLLLGADDLADGGLRGLLDVAAAGRLAGARGWRGATRLWGDEHRRLARFLRPRRLSACGGRSEGAK